MATHTDIEIELKLLVPEDAGEIIQQSLLPILDGTIEQSEVELSNDYFDSPERILRKNDIGFRIRGCNGVFEQTLKTAGKIIGGLHQRPEFNVSLTQPVAALSRFDKKVWPKTIDPNLLQKQLSVIFSTRFTRQIYLITFADDSVVELVWDKGEVLSNRKREQICEIELELKRGSVEKLFTIAKEIVGLMAVKMGNDSKAARGYALCDGANNKLRSLPETIDLARDDTAETGFTNALEVGLGHWQHHEKLFLSNTKAIALHNVYEGMELVFSALAMYKPVLHCKPIADLHRKLELWMNNWRWCNDYYIYSLFASSNNVHHEELAKSPQLISLLRERADDCVLHYQPEKLLLNSSNVMLQLEITELLINMPWRQASDNYLSPLRDFAKQQGEQNQKIIVDILASQESLQGKDYICHAKILRNIAREGYFFGVAITNKYRQRCTLCRDLVIGIDELELWLKLKSFIETSNIDDNEALLAWCNCKMLNLISVMERSRQEEC